MTEISSTGDQMLHLLELVAFGGPMTTAELATAAGMNRTVAHRLLATLHRRGFVSRQGKMFALGPVLGQMASLGDLNGLLGIVRPPMRQLADETGETVVLHRIDGDNAVVVEQAVSDVQLVRVQHREGSRHALTIGASGRAILAFQPEGFIRRILAQVEAPDILAGKLADTREKGYATSRNELQMGVAGVAVPLHEAGSVVRFSLGILLPLQREDRLATVLPALLKVQRDLALQTCGNPEQDRTTAAGSPA